MQEIDAITSLQEIYAITYMQLSAITFLFAITISYCVVSRRGPPVPFAWRCPACTVCCPGAPMPSACHASTPTGMSTPTPPTGTTTGNHGYFLHNKRQP